MRKLSFLRKISFLPVFLILAACVSIPTQDVRVAYISDFDSYKGLGAATVEGQAFLRQQGGGVVLCAGEEVLLIPNEGFFGESYRLAKSGTRPVPDGDKNRSVSQIASTDPNFTEVVRKARCDAQGNFTFEQVPAGEWIVFSTVKWIVGDIPQGSTLGVAFTLRSGEQKRILLTDSDRI